MTGPEHFKAAEQLLACVDVDGIAGPPTDVLAQAQVHATLALAAAVALSVADGPNFPETRAARAWREVLLPR